MLQLLHFQFKTPLHIGTIKLEMDSSDTVLHSDTLYAALVNAWAQLGQSVSDIVDGDGNPLGYALSSLFPFCTTKSGELLHFLPLPKEVMKRGEKVDKKKADKVRYLDFAHFKQLQKQGNMPVDNELALHGEYMTEAAEFTDKFMSKEVYPRVKVPRSGITSETEPYYLERIFFQQGAGFYCIADWTDTDSQVKSKVMAALAFLGDEGLGSDRHVGNGMFEITASDMDVSDLLQANSDYRINISMFCPDTKEQLTEMLDDHCAYELPVKRGGWMSKEGYLTYRKKAVFMFKEGGIFKLDKPSAGKTHNLQPKNTPNPVNEPVWRCGKSIFLPIARQTT